MTTSHGQRSSTDASCAAGSHQGEYVRLRELMARQMSRATCCGCIAGLFLYSCVGSIMRVRTRGK